MRQRIARSLGDLDYYQASPLGWKHGVIIGWAGMRGSVSLAAALALPINFPARDLIVFAAFVVIMVTLVGQGQFTETVSEVRVRFVLLPSGFSVLGVGAAADFADGVHGATLTYRQIACNPWVWWNWLTPLAGTFGRLFRR